MQEPLFMKKILNKNLKKIKYFPKVMVLFSKLCYNNIKKKAFVIDIAKRNISQ